MQAAFDHLVAADPILAPLLQRVGLLPANEETPPEGHFEALARIVVGQQLSTVVARAIWKRVEASFEGKVEPEAVLARPLEALRTLGLSNAKARYLHNLAEAAQGGTLRVHEMEALSNEEVLREITAIKGFGPWSADMFLMFHLQRHDILPVGDLGIREAVRRLYGLEERPAPAELTQIAEVWRPYRTVACRYLWRSLDNEPAP